MAKKRNIKNKFIRAEKKKSRKKQIINKTDISNLKNRINNVKNIDIQKSIFPEVLIKK